jgi:Zn-dependent protease with chaperone function
MIQILRDLRLPSPSTLCLYAATLVAEVPVIIARLIIAFFLVVLVLLVQGDSTASAERIGELAWIPTAWSVFALLNPLGGGWWWAQNMGGRKPSDRERSVYQDAIDLLQAHSQASLRLPSRWFVVDEPQPDAAVCGNTLMLSRGLLESEYLAAVLAHELGHLMTSDGKLTAAINRLIINPLPKTHERRQREQSLVVVGGDRLNWTITGLSTLFWLLRRIVRFSQGGFGLRITRPFWGSYWREREYLADQYAASLGQADELADFLEIHALINDHPVPFIWLTEHTHPPTEPRIDKLRAARYAEIPASVAVPADEPHPAHQSSSDDPIAIYGETRSRVPS